MMSTACSFRSALAALLVPVASSFAAAPGEHEKTLAEIARVAAAGPFRPDWDSLGRFQVPDWYQDAKFGIFIHWGVYAVPSFGTEWYPREMYIQEKSRKGIFAHHQATWGSVDKFGYKDFIPMFQAEKFDPAAWARLFKASGARYVIPVAEHHDGFAMYDSAYSRWTAARMGPKRDLIADLAKAVRQEGLVLGLSSHRAENWWFYGGGRKLPSDVQDERYRDLYGPAADRAESEAGKTPPDKAFLDDWLLRCSELVDKYQPQVIWFDWWMAQPAFHQHLKVFSAYYYNRGQQWGRGVAINYKKHGGESYPDTAGVLDIERGQLSQKRDLFWQTDTSVSKNSWGYIAGHDYKTVNSLVDDLIDIVSKNGAMLLNIGPRADGTIPEREQEMLLEIGAWLRRNGEAIYETRPWVVFGEGPTAVIEGTFAEKKRKDFTREDIRYTTRGDVLYAHLLDWPEAGRPVRLGAVNGERFTTRIGRVELLGTPGALVFEQTKSGLLVTLPARPTGPGAEHAFVLRITPAQTNPTR